MAERRMFAKTIIDSDAFTDMPLSTQALYFHLSMRADDDGFINNPKKIQRMIGCADDDLKLLIAKGFIIPFESGIVVIKHWKIHNYIQNDRYRATAYTEEKSMLVTKGNGAYTLAQNSMDTECIQVGYKLDTQDRLGKISTEIEIEKTKEGTNNSYEKVLSEFVIGDQLKEAIREFIKMRKLNKKPMTDKALKLLINKLRGLATDEQTQIEIINQSIIGGWQSVYPLKTNSNTNRVGANGVKLADEQDHTLDGIL